METRWYRQDKPAVLDALRRGERPSMATTTASGPPDASIALHVESGVFDALDRLPVDRPRTGIDDAPLLRTPATLRFLSGGGLDPSARLSFRDPASLLRSGWAPAQIQAGDDRRHRHPEGRQVDSLPCHPDTLRDASRRVAVATWPRAREIGVAASYQHRFVRGRVDAIDGSGPGNDSRLVCLVCASAQRPVIVARRSPGGAASETGREAEVTPEPIEQAPESGGPGCIGLLPADAPASIDAGPTTGARRGSVRQGTLMGPAGFLVRNMQ